MSVPNLNFCVLCEYVELSRVYRLIHLKWIKGPLSNKNLGYAWIQTLFLMAFACFRYFETWPSGRSYV